MPVYRTGFDWLRVNKPCVLPELQTQCAGELLCVWGLRFRHGRPCTSPRLRPSCKLGAWRWPPTRINERGELLLAWPRWYSCTGDSWLMQGGR